MIVNEQSRAQVDLAEVRALVARLRHVLALGNRNFNVCFVEDARIVELNRAFRGKPHPTDVLSFPWQGHESFPPSAERAESAAEFQGFLGDVVISIETARRNAGAEGHALGREISWLILHGLLHLLGMDHETDQGEMVAMEYDLRARLGLDSGMHTLGKPTVQRKRRTRPRRGRKHISKSA